MNDGRKSRKRKRGRRRAAALLLAAAAIALSGCGRGDVGSSPAPGTISVEVGDARFSLPADFALENLADDATVPCPPRAPRAHIASASFAWETGFCDTRGLDAPHVMAAPARSLPALIRERIDRGEDFRAGSWSGRRLQLDPANARWEYHFPELNLYLQVLALDRDDVTETIMATLERR